MQKPYLGLNIGMQLRDTIHGGTMDEQAYLSKILNMRAKANQSHPFWSPQMIACIIPVVDKNVFKDVQHIHCQCKPVYPTHLPDAFR